MERLPPVTKSNTNIHLRREARLRRFLRDNRNSNLMNQIILVRRAGFEGSVGVPRSDKLTLLGVLRRNVMVTASGDRLVTARLPFGTI